MPKVSIIFIVLVSLLLCGCSERRPLRIGVSQCSNDDWRRKMNEEILREAMFHDDIEIEIRSADDSNDKQIADLRYFADNDFDVIIAAPNEADALTPVIKEIYDSGKPVILFDRNIHGDSYTAFQGADNAAIGRHAAIKALSYIGKGGKVLEICGLAGSTPAEERQRGFDEQAQADSLTILARAEGRWNYNDAAAKIDSLLRIYPDVDLIYAHNDRMAIAASETARAMGRNGIKIIGIDAAPSIGIQAVADSVIDATFLYPTEGYQLVRTAIAIANNEPFERELYLADVSPVDANNADILLLQDQALRDETNKIDTLTGKIDTYWREHSMQQALLYGAIIIALLLAIVVFLLLRAYWNHTRHRQQIERRNKELADQKDEISALYQQLQEATQSKLTFFTNVSHDLRTPLTLIADPVSQLAEASNLTPGQHTLMQLADKNVKILMRLINQILDIRKSDNGQLRLNLTEINLGEQLKEWAEAFANAATRRHIHFNVDVDTSDKMLTAVDIDKMERIIYNLISNAFKFTPENGTISLTSHCDDGKIVIKVADTGCGIPADEIAQVFDRFFKTDNVNPQGSGIGLALTKVFVELHSGSIAVESTTGKGSVFTVTLPIAHTGQKPAETAPLSANLSTLNLIEPDDDEVKTDTDVVLVIDDNPDICALVKSVLQEQYTVIQAHSGAEGIRKASKYIPTLIICDVMMPGIDGFETCRRLKDEVVTSHIPVLMLTACSSDDQRTEGYESGADGYISKPFDSKLLKARCASLIANRRRISGSEVATDATAPKAAPKHDIDDEFYNRFIDIVEKNIGNAELSVEDVASDLGMSRVQMYRKLKALTNYSPNELIRNERLRRASTLLKTTEATISEICYTVGFTSPSYFTKCYKEYFNESPSDTQSRTSKYL